MLGFDGRRDDLADFRILYESRDGFAFENLDDIYHALHRWNAATDLDQLNDPDSDDSLLCFKVGCVWVLSRSLMLCFNPEEKVETFDDWKEFAFVNVEKLCSIYLRS